MRPLADCRLYGILDLGYVPLNYAVATARLMLEGEGVDILQLRAKNHPPDAIEHIAHVLHQLTEQAGVPFIINDLPAVAARIRAEGAHIGQDDGTLEDARKEAHAKCLIGRSTHSLDQAIAAEKEGADYIGFGPLFATPTKPDYTPIGIHEIREVYERVKIPIFCIGGIKLENLKSVMDAGASRVVIVSGILEATDIPGYIEDCRILLPSR
ncbi:MAG: thiamine phosphate synthase [Chthoniobacterales bacterium]